MNKRFLSALLAIVLCFAVCFTSFADMTPMANINVDDFSGGTIKQDAARFINSQLDAMTSEQREVLDKAYAKYSTDETKAQVKAIISEQVDEVFKDNTVFFENESLKDLYKWKLMRDIVFGNADVAVSGDAYQAWFDEFKPYEERNDEAVSIRTPYASLDILKPYSSDLHTYFEELRAIVKTEGVTVTGADADKLFTYVDAAESDVLGTELSEDEKTVFDAYLLSDVKELVNDALFDLTDISIGVITGKLVIGDRILDMIESKHFKAAFLMLGEDYVRELLGITGDVQAIVKELDIADLTEKALGARAIYILGGENQPAVDAMYTVTKAVSEKVVTYPTVGKYVTDFENQTGVTYADDFDRSLDAVRSILDLISTYEGGIAGGVELVYLNTYMGRALLKPETATEIEVKAGEETELDLTMMHSNENIKIVLEKLQENISLGSFEVVCLEGEGVTVEATEMIGKYVIKADASAAGNTAALGVYRGCSDAYTDAEDVFRYVSFYTVTVTGEEEPSTEPSSEATEPTTEPSSEATEPEEAYITIDDIADADADGEIVVKGKTNLPYVTVVITKADATLNTFVEVYEKAEYEAGITIPVPYEAEEGDVYTVLAGTEKANAETTFKIKGGTVVTDTIVLAEVADAAEDGTIFVTGTTTLPYVTVVLTKVGDKLNTFVKIYTKAEFEKGITIPVPDGAQEDDEYVVIAGAAKVVDTKSFKIFKGGEEPSTEPSSEVTEPTTEPTSEPTEPSSEATEPSSEASEPTTEEPTGEKATLALAGGDTRTVYKNSKKVITTTPQNAPEGVKVVWTVADDSIVSVDALAGDWDNLATIKGISYGTTTVTATLYDKDNNKLDEKTVTVTVKRSGGGGGGGTVTPTEPTEPTQPGGDTTHKCEWPDIAATDTKAAHWAHETIDIMTINGYISGYPDGTFKPDDKITRAEFSAIVYRILGLTKANDGVEYADTKGHWAENIIGTMSLPEGYGMLRGYGDGNFGPNDLITREQAVAIIARAKSAVWSEAKEGAKDVLTDAGTISLWFAGEMDSAVTNGLVEGYEDGSFKPLDNTTRAEACTLLARAWPEILETASTAVE